MTPQFDVIIIGSGPSGASCAYNLKRFHPNASVLLIDKASFPRDKTCGGGVSPDVSNYIDFDLSDAIDYHCNEVVLVTNNKSISSHGSNILMVRRTVFDDFLLNKAIQQGVETRMACEVMDIERGITQNIVKTQAGHFSAKLVVLAEGASGRLARKLGITLKNAVWAGLEYEHYTKELDGKLRIYFNHSENGYTWNFPKSDGLSLGIGGLIKGKQNVSLPQQLKHFLKQYSITTLEKKNLHGHPIQVYNGRQKLVHGSLLLVGEIAGCVDPLTAEGIRPAIKSGYLAAQVLAEVLSSNKRQNLKRYDALFHREIGKDFQYARIVAYFMNHYRQITTQLLSSATAVDRFMSVFMGQSTYRAHLSLGRIIRLIKKILSDLIQKKFNTTNSY